MSFPQNMPAFVRRSLLASCCTFALSLPALATDYVIDTAVTELNGGFVLQPDDTLTVTQDGSILGSAIVQDSTIRHVAIFGPHPASGTVENH